MRNATTHLKRPKSEILREWMERKRTFTTHDLIGWAAENWYLRAVRQAQEMAVNGELERLNWSQQVDLGIIGAEEDEIGAWKYVKTAIDKIPVLV